MGRSQQWGELTPKEIRFCEEFIKDFNATQACIRLGIGNPNNAAQTAHKYTKKPEVRAYIEKLLVKTSERCETTVDDLMRFWTTILNDPNESTNNRLKASDYLGKVLGAFVTKIETKQAPTIIMDLGLPPTSEPLALVAAEEYTDDDLEDTEYDS